MQKFTLTCAIAVFVSFSSYPLETQAQLTQLTSADLIPTQFGFQQPDYTGDAPSGRDRGTGSRGDCPLAAGTQGKVTLTPLIPTDSRGLTTKASPTLWVQVAYASNQIDQELSGELSVEDAQTFTKLPPQTIPITLPKNSAVFSIPLPHSLEINKWYRWYLVLDCKASNSGGSDAVMSIEGMVKRVELPELEHQLETQPIQERIKIYAQWGIWYDALDGATQLSCGEEQNRANQSWQVLLRDDDVDWDKVGQTPLICPN